MKSGKQLRYQHEVGTSKEHIAELISNDLSSPKASKSKGKKKLKKQHQSHISEDIQVASISMINDAQNLGTTKLLQITDEILEKSALNGSPKKGMKVIENQ